MAFWKKVGNAFRNFGGGVANAAKRVGGVARDVATSATRIVTDTAIDLGNVATGFRFEDRMAAAKKKLSDAGIRSAAEAIERNRYGFLQDMEAQVRAKIDAIHARVREGRSLAAEREQRVADLFGMLAQVDLLAQMSLQAKELLGPAADIPAWRRRSIDLDDLVSTLRAIDESAAEWERIGRLVIASGIAGTGSAAAGVGSGRALAKASELAKAAKSAGARAARLSSAASKFATIGKLAGRASGVLAVAAVGLDIGMTVAQLEARKDELEDQLERLDDGLAEADQRLAAMRYEREDLDRRIEQLLTSVDPAQTEASWDDWVAATRDELRRLRNHLTSLAGARDKALRLARRTRDRGYGAHRVAYVASVDLSITPDQARAIIALADAPRADAGADAGPGH